MEKQIHADRIVVYDGHCNLCSRWIPFFRRYPLYPPFTLVPVQSPEGRGLLLKHGIDPDDPSTFLVIDGSKTLMGSDAFIHLMTSVGGIRRGYAALHFVPHSIREWIYRVVARNRYHWFGRNAVCQLPDRKS